ncbi:hypothetical protein JW877_01650 [bacterium]|nr:hypothetical protein [bacterium]
MKLTLKISIVVTGLILIAMLTGCGQTYHGQYITTVIDEEPMDEFKVGDYVVLAITNEAKRSRESWFYKFYLYRNGDKVREFRLVARIVRQRSFFLQEIFEGEVANHAHFATEPSYDVVKERLIFIIRGESQK